MHEALLLDAGASSGRGPGAAAGTRARRERREEKVVRCVHCNGKLALVRDAIAVAGRHEHTQLNPAGIIFRFGCYARADGCRIHGDPSDEQCWFPGTLWQYACCASCLEHVGWRWSGEAPGTFFFGLILDRVR